MSVLTVTATTTLCPICGSRWITDAGDCMPCYTTPKRRGFKAGDPRATAAGKIGGKVSGESRKAKRAAYWEAQGVDPVKAETIYQSGYNAGWVKGRRGK